MRQRITMVNRKVLKRPGAHCWFACWVGNLLSRLPFCSVSVSYIVLWWRYIKYSIYIVERSAGANRRRLTAKVVMSYVSGMAVVWQADRSTGPDSECADCVRQHTFAFPFIFCCFIRKRLIVNCVHAVSFRLYVVCANILETRSLRAIIFQL